MNSQTNNMIYFNDMKENLARKNLKFFVEEWKKKWKNGRMEEKYKFSKINKLIY